MPRSFWKASIACVLAMCIAHHGFAQTPPGRLGRVLGDMAVPSGLGVNVHFTAAHADTLRRIREFGFRIVRTDLLWAAVEQERGAYDWRPFDALVADTRAAGLIPLLILAYSNPLYSPKVPGMENIPSRSFAVPKAGEARVGFMHFARAAAQHFGASVMWEIWNEPDLNFGTPFDLDSYVSFAVETCHEVREASAESVIIGPAASGFAWRLLHRFMVGDRSACFDAISVHPYRDRAPEDVLGDWANLSAMLCPAGSACPALVSSEWGYSAWGGEWTAERQADYVLRLYMLNLLSHVPVSIIYDWQDDGPSPNDKEANFGLLDYPGAPKPVYHALRRLVRELEGLHFLGRVETPGSRSVVLAFGTSAGPTKLVAWSDAAPLDMVVPAGACITADLVQGGNARAAGSCPAGVAVMPHAVSIRLTSRPSTVIVPSATSPGADTQ
jgi:hypothetical protein